MPTDINPLDKCTTHGIADCKNDLYKPNPCDEIDLSFIYNCKLWTQYLQIKRLTETSIVPNSAHHDDIGYDLYADKTYNIMPGMSAKISTGIALAQPSSYWIKFFDRSSRAFPDKAEYSSRSLVVLGGVIDNYRGEIFVILHNLSQGSEEDTIQINPGDKIAQMVLLPFIKLPTVIVEELPGSNRGDKGFGSSGK